MMRIQCMQIIKIIFVLSTIVAVTDCCSSRILLLREHTLKIVQHQHNFHNHLHEHAHQLQQQIEEHVVQLVNQMELQQKLDEQLQQSDTDAEREQVQQPETETKVEIDTGQDETIFETDVEGPALTLEMASSTLEPDLDFITDESSSTATTPKITTTTTTPPKITTTTTTTPTTTSTTTMKTTTPSTKPKFTVTPTDEPPPDDTTSPGETTVEPDKDGVTLSIQLPTGKERGTVDFDMLPCSEPYKTHYCLNGGRCFRLPVSNHTLNSCVCPDGYDGSRCDFKSWNGDYVSTPVPVEHQPKILMAHIVFSFPMLILLSTIYVLFAAVFMFRNAPEHRRKQQQLQLHKQRFFVSC